jgi:hypothetical protein
MATSAGEAAYEKWCERVYPKEVIAKFQKPLPIQPWDKLRDGTKATWEAVAQAAIKHTAKR